ncbi:MAG: isochorismatase family protein [Proteobacteria bacterium]|nr:isochorismatase family protein [Pseudomonadota bacterium]
MNIKALKSQIASLDVDAQYSFTPVCPNELPIPSGHEIVDELNRQATFATYRIGSKDAHSPKAKWVATKENPVLSKIEGKNIDVRWPEHCVPGTKGFENLEGLPHPHDYDFYVWKGVEPDMHPYGACYHDLQDKLSTGVIEFLHQKKVTTVIVGGLATDYCLKNTVMQLLKAGFITIVNLGASRGLAPKTTRDAIELMKQNGAIIIQSSAELPTLLNNFELTIAK